MRASELAAEDMYDRPLFSSRLVQVGVFRCPVGHPRFTDSGPTETYCLVFPRNAVWIAHEGRPPFVADATVVPVYNPGRPYRRGPISAAGDRSDWFAVAPDVLREIVARYDACAADSDALFRFGWTPSDAATYLAQRQIYRHVRGERPVDRLWVEESVISLAAAVLARACRRRTMSAAACATRDGRLAARVRESLAASFCRSGGLEALANDVGASVFHLCRVFRRESGGTIHQYRTQLRLRRSLELLDQGETDILDVALRVGFCSHSHSRASFTRPSASRRPRSRRASGRSGNRAWPASFSSDRGGRVLTAAPQTRRSANASQRKPFTQCHEHDPGVMTVPRPTATQTIRRAATETCR